MLKFYKEFYIQPPKGGNSSSKSITDKVVISMNVVDTVTKNITDEVIIEKENN